MKKEFSKLLYLNKEKVVSICNKLNSIEIIRDVFILHSENKTVLPDEAYLSWINLNNETPRSLNMPAYLGGTYNIAGTKIINANIENAKYGVTRASGLTLLFDSLTGIILCVMEGGFISSLRTASVSVLGVKILKRNGSFNLSVIGLGIQGEMHLKMLIEQFPDIQNIYIFDTDPSKSKKIIQSYRNRKIKIAKNQEEAVKNSDVIVTTTTVDKGYIKPGWLKKGSLVVHVSLDDLLPAAIAKADKLIVDDWNLVKTGTKRIFGKMYQKGKMQGPESSKPGVRIYSEFCDIVSGKKKGRANDEEIIVFNPFGLAIEDIAIASTVYRFAKKNGIGEYLER